MDLTREDVAIVELSGRISFARNLLEHFSLATCFSFTYIRLLIFIFF